jgi:hypothetical protein
MVLELLMLLVCSEEVRGDKEIGVSGHSFLSMDVRVYLHLLLAGPQLTSIIHPAMHVMPWAAA